jgi:DNA-directed RNA polymerase subunit RPC12/RpoP
MDPKRLPAMLPKRQREKVQELMDRPDCTRVSYSHDLFLCPKCGLPASRLNYQIEFKNEEVFQPSFRCSQCGTGLIKTDQLPRLDRCPKCGSTNLFESMGEWD